MPKLNAAKDVECPVQETSESFTYSATSHLRCQDPARECLPRKELANQVIDKSDWEGARSVQD